MIEIEAYTKKSIIKIPFKNELTFNDISTNFIYNSLTGYIYEPK